MKAVKFALIGCIVFMGSLAIAQETTGEKKHEGNHEAMLEQLELTEEQETQIEALKSEQETKVSEIKADTDLADADKKAKIMELRKELREKMNEILTEEQRAELKELKAAHKEDNGPTPGEIAAKQTEKLNELLDLTDDQLEQVRELNLKVATKIDVIKKDDSMSAEKKREFIKGNKQDHKTMMKSILTEEQFQTYEEHLAARKSLRAHPKKVKPTDAPSTGEKATE